MSKANEPQLAVNHDFGAENVLERVELGQQSNANDIALLETSIAAPELKREEITQNSSFEQRKPGMPGTPRLDFGMPELDRRPATMISSNRLTAAKVQTPKQLTIQAPRGASTIVDRFVSWLALQIRLLVEKLLFLLGKQPALLKPKMKVILPEDPEYDALLIEQQTRKRRKIQRPLLHSFE